MHLEQLLVLLGYSTSGNYRTQTEQFHPLEAHIFRSAKLAGADGVYVFHASPDDELLPIQPAVFVAKASSVEHAREIHRRLWNLSKAPFLIILLENQIRIYTGFDYDQRDTTRGLIRTVRDLTSESAISSLSDFGTESIDSGRLWDIQAKHLKPERRVDEHLLNNLRRLQEALVENKKQSLDLPTAHALIGKYVYIKYLVDRRILSQEWLLENHIQLDQVLGREATLDGFFNLINALDQRFNGGIFPLPVSARDKLKDSHVALVASVFKGDNPISGQLHFDAEEFKAYDFSYIPVETLSSIYEQFLHAQGKGKKVGAFYTPEPVADYLLNEINYHSPLNSGLRILDPSCGSGIFLVLAYRRLIEDELGKNKQEKLRPTDVRRLLEGIYGVERNKEACYVTEFSLILTMLHYIDPPELHRNKQFKFPVLHNTQIFECDFFDDNSEFWKKGQRYDWVVGNPPWVELKDPGDKDPNDVDERFALDWIAKNRKERPVARNRVSEAFSWRALDVLSETGCVGLLVHAKSLFNIESKHYRKEFFRQNQVLRITNFSNLAYVLFMGRAEAPAATIIYKRTSVESNKPPIIHYGPFVAHQIFYRRTGVRQPAWVITVNESEIQGVSHEEAEKGEAITWKLALWGTHRDKRALRRLQKLFATTLGELANRRLGWNISVGLQLRHCSAQEEITHEPHLGSLKRLDLPKLRKSGLHLSIPQEALEDIPEDMCYIRARGGDAGLNVAYAPHTLLKLTGALYSDEHFVIPHPQIGISCPLSDADYLRAISVYLNSRVSRYYLFFQSSSWGVDRSQIALGDAQEIPVPALTYEQVRALAELHSEVTTLEATYYSRHSEIEEILNERLETILGIPRSLSILAKDFVSVRLQLNKGKVTSHAVRVPHQNELLEYGYRLRDELDEFTKETGIRHKVSITPVKPWIRCTVETINSERPIEVSVRSTSGYASEALAKWDPILTERFNQWVYYKRSLRIIEPSKIHIFKSARLVDWTPTQALNDSDDIIEEVLTSLSEGITSEAS